MKKQLKRALFLFLFFPCGLGAQSHIIKLQSPELSKLFGGGQKIWDITAETFLKIQSKNGFVWNSDYQRDSVRSIHPNLRFLGILVYEANAYFQESKLNNMVLSIYNRGDAGLVTKEDLSKYLGSVREAISMWTKSSPTSKSQKRRTSKIKIARITWIKGDTRIALEWSTTTKHKRQGVIVPFRSEFIRIKLTSVNNEGGGKRLSDSSFAEDQTISFARAKSKVSKNEIGDIYLEQIPMINQGNKNYCAAATVSRILAYYEKDIDQHEVAQMVGTSRLGTNPEKMVELLQQVAHKLGVRVRTHQDFRSKDLVNRIEKYNRLARRERKEEIELHRNTPLSFYYAQMDKNILFRMLTEKPVLNRFYRELKKYVQIGIPLAWSVILGVIEESPPLPQRIGGHMRLLIGYNPRTKEVIYTDSWGPGHEFKRMSLKNAVTITVGLYTIEPRSRRF